MGKHSLADVDCWVHVLLTKLPQLPVSQPSTTAAPRVSEHPLAPSTWPKPAAHSHSPPAQRQSRESPTPPNCLRAHSRQHHPAETAAMGQGQRDPHPSPRITHVTQGLLHLPGSLSTHTLQHFPALSGGCRAAAHRLGDHTELLSLQDLSASCLQTLQRAVPLPSQGGCPARKGCLPREQSQRARE